MSGQGIDLWPAEGPTEANIILRSRPRHSAEISDASIILSNLSVRLPKPWERFALLMSLVVCLHRSSVSSGRRIKQRLNFFNSFRGMSI